jgi:hypothetical protein
MHNRMLARVPRGLRPKQRVTIVIRCPDSGELARYTRRRVVLAPFQPYGQGGISYEVATTITKLRMLELMGVASADVVQL